MASDSFEYQGSELELFEKAVVWKDYWSSQISKYFGRNILEVGAGIGANTKLLSNSHDGSWTTLEPDPTQCEEIRKRISDGRLQQGLAVRCGTLADMEQKELFDTILYIDVLEHIEQDRMELELAMSRLEANGRVIVLSPAHNSLFSEFDTHVGHFRRYDKAMLREITPEGLSIESMFYLDSVGMAASYANKVLLKASLPSPEQIKFWDTFIVRVSRIVDPILLHKLGKTIVCVYRKE